MKKISKLISVLLVVTMVLSLGVSAMAAGEASIEIENAQEGTTYSAYMLFKATTNADGGVSYVYDANTSVLDDLEINWEAYKIPGSANAVTLDADAVTALANELKTKDLSKATASGTYDPETGKIEGLDYGYYFVSTGTGAVVSMDTATPTAKVVDKNVKPGFPSDDPTYGKNVAKVVNGTPGEYVDGNAVTGLRIGDTASFRVKLAATNYDELTQIVQYTMTDTLGAGFEFVKDSVVVTVSGETDPLTRNDMEDTSKLGAKEFSVAFTGDNTIMTVVIQWVDPSSGASLFNPTCDLTVTYQAKLTADAATSNTNHVEYDWTGRTINKPDDGTETNLYYTDIVKTKNSDTSVYELLPGAEFTLKGTAESDTQNIKFVYDADHDWYRVAAEGETGDDTLVVTNGKIRVYGLAKGTDYELTETKAPDGYNLLAAPATINLSNDSTAIVEHNEYNKSAAGQAGLHVINEAGTELPSTGGMGTTILYIVGAALLIGAAVVLVVRKRSTSAE